MSRSIVALAASALAALAVSSPGARAQELVVNGGAEAYTRCPTGPGLIDGWLDDWHRASVASTDFHHACGFTGHASRTGDGHVGLLAYDFSPNYREYGTARLASPLVAGREYRLDMWVLLDPGRLHAVQELGAWFSASAPTWPGTVPPGVVPHAEHAGGTLTDKVNWTLVSLSYVATGGEQHVTIGNFRDDASTTVTGWPCCGQYGAYYHVDDVSLVEVGATPPPRVACSIVDDSCPLDASASGDGHLDFSETVELKLAVTNPGAADLTNVTFSVEVTGGVLLDPTAPVDVPSLAAGASHEVSVLVRLPAAGDGAACGAPVDVRVTALASDQTAPIDDDLAACDFAIGDPSGACDRCVVPAPCLWRADLGPSVPPPDVASLFMPETPEGLSIAGPSWQCPIADGDLERDAMALQNGVRLSFYQVDRPVGTLRLAKSGTTIRFRF